MSHVDHILKMRSNTVKNYALAGLNSSLLENGMVRLFEQEREQHDSITPHSHKFNFQCLVLSGQVTNRVWYESDKGDEFMLCESQYLGEMGKYNVSDVSVGKYEYVEKTYNEGDWYGMHHNEIHSIKFSKGAKVLFFEGELVSNFVQILKPYVNGEAIDTLEVKKWMFKR